MRIKFRQTTPSDSPDCPFQPGQVIDVPALTDTMEAWLTDGFADLLPEEAEPALETASVIAPEHAVQPRAKARRV